ncbi:hypothetical protein EJB05_10589 [Eragrostis curvula]|uniref:Protein LURP-one-related 11 n=1 Tax=Eragrostis curvula TaxID=38414 RepID=A0A5J9VM99_9POAL|nr:hypothetical protein EJB05_10589 [Eragrostis curvula]
MRAVMDRRVHVRSTSQSPSAAYTGKVVFTVWMKSLVLNGHGCAVYDSNGRLVYRVDNYGTRCSGSVCLMDVDGNIILKVLKKKLAFGRWEGYRWRGEEQEPRPWFTVARQCSPFQRRRRSRRPSSSASCECQSDDTGSVMLYTIITDECLTGKKGCRIIDEATGLVVAEVKRKVTANGVALGDDVLALGVEPDADESLVMGLVLVYGLMNHCM